MFCQEHPKRDQNPKFTPLSETTSIPTPFTLSYTESPLPSPGSGTKLRWTHSHDGTLEGSYTKSHIILYNYYISSVLITQPIGRHGKLQPIGSRRPVFGYLKPEAGTPILKWRDTPQKIQITGKPFIYVCGSSINWPPREISVWSGSMVDFTDIYIKTKRLAQPVERLTAGAGGHGTGPILRALK